MREEWGRDWKREESGEGREAGKKKNEEKRKGG